MEAMFANVRKQLNAINNKQISLEQKNIEAREVASKEWKMIINEIPLGGEDGKGLIMYPSYENKTHLLNFLAEAHSHMTPFLHKHLKNGPIKCMFMLNLHFINEKTEMETNQTVTSNILSYADIFELSGFIHELHGVYQNHIIEYCASKEGCEFDEVQNFKIMII